MDPDADLEQQQGGKIDQMTKERKIGKQLINDLNKESFFLCV